MGLVFQMDLELLRARGPGTFRTFLFGRCHYVELGRLAFDQAGIVVACVDGGNRASWRLALTPSHRILASYL